MDMFTLVALSTFRPRSDLPKRLETFPFVVSAKRWNEAVRGRKARALPLMILASALNAFFPLLVKEIQTALRDREPDVSEAVARGQHSIHHVGAYIAAHSFDHDISIAQLQSRYLQRLAGD